MGRDLFKKHAFYKRPKFEHIAHILSSRMQKHQMMFERVQQNETKMVKKLKNISYEDRAKALEQPTFGNEE